MHPLITNIAQAPQVFFAKNTVSRRHYPLALDLDGFSPWDYEKVIPRLREVEQQLLAVPADARGMRWIHLRDTVYFYGERVFDVPYDEFVTEVNISHAGEFYRDSLSVATRVMARDHFGRPVRQGVRIVALPQPNYAAFLGKGNLDVYKLEKVEYGEDEQRVWMLTVHSPNASAVCDDGYMTFKRGADGRSTIVAFLACQNFPIPPVMAMIRLDRWTWLKTKLTESAYRRFCNTMMNNILDCYRGRCFQIGRAGNSAAQNLDTL